METVNAEANSDAPFVPTEENKRSGKKFCDDLDEACRFYRQVARADSAWMQEQIDSGVDLNAVRDFRMQDNMICTFMSVALTCCNDLDAIKLLVANGGSLNAPGAMGRNIIHDVAMATSNPEILQYLMDNGASIFDTSDGGDVCGVFHGACNFNKNPKVLQFLLDKGADVNGECRYGDTPIFGALNGNSNTPECIEVLIQAGADINHKNKRGNTPLHYLGYGYTNLRNSFKTLIKHKPDALALNNAGENIWEFGYKHGKGYLRQHRVSLLYRYWRKAKRDQWEESLNV